MRLVLVLLLLNSVANPAVPPGLITFNDDGAWNWFQDERAIVVGGKLIVASIAAGAHDPARAGAVEVAAYDPAGGITARFALHDDSLYGSDNLHTKWLDEHAREIGDLRATLETITTRFEQLGETIDDRIQSEEYLSLVRRAFRVWDEASTEEKRRYVANVLAMRLVRVFARTMSCGCFWIGSTRTTSPTSP